MKRAATLSRRTTETNINLELNLDGEGKYNIKTGFKFMDHMLSLLAKHSGIDLSISASGDLTHHVIEDIGIVFGKCFREALNDKRGINRYGFAIIPMDESLARCAIDLSDRKGLEVDLKLTDCNIEDVAVEDVYHFLDSFAENAKMNLHLQVLYGKDQHHKVESAFKALAQSIKKAIEITNNEIRSTKGRI
ncbi:MAG: imidazoleglycerol-phosphate dehydratase HisB [Candidatus Thorarchaeota archaeon]